MSVSAITEVVCVPKLSPKTFTASEAIQLNEVPVTLLVKVSPTLSPLHIFSADALVTKGEGNNVTTRGCGVPEQPLKIGVTK